jgi:hypothetical protein
VGDTPPGEIQGSPWLNQVFGEPGCQVGSELGSVLLDHHCLDFILFHDFPPLLSFYIVLDEGRQLLAILPHLG